MAEFQRYRLADSAANESLADLYQASDGPSLDFLNTLLKQSNGRAYIACESALESALESPLESALESALGTGCETALEVGHEGSLITGAIFLSFAADEADVVDIRVLPSHREQRIGTQLLKIAIESLAAEGVHHFHLEVRASNSAARRLYDRLGFMVVGTRRHYYRSQEGSEDAILMALNVRPEH